MSIPLDKLYHYIESVANDVDKDIRGDNVIIYRFYPHGSKKIDDLLPLDRDRLQDHPLLPSIYCNDQEPLRYDYYQDKAKQIPNTTDNSIAAKHGFSSFQLLNLRQEVGVYDRVLLLHSELRSADVIKYKNNGYIPVYYWCHAIIARDWYRYARHEKFNKNVKKLFLIYNRAWSGTREYRLKFIDLLIKYNLVDVCHTTFNPIEPELNIHYTDHEYISKQWKPEHALENFITKPSLASSSASADYEIKDYNLTDFEIVLETLFDDERIQLTEKILRPIALGQPFLLASTHGSLEYLRSYGFKTFSSIIDETYDTIEDPLQRLEAIVKCMKDIANWNHAKKTENLLLAKEITDYNRQHFFSDKFFNQVESELRDNLRVGLTDLENTNTGYNYLHRRMVFSKVPELKERFIMARSKAEIINLVKTARKYYNRRLQQK